MRFRSAVAVPESYRTDEFRVAQRIQRFSCYESPGNRGHQNGGGNSAESRFPVATPVMNYTEFGVVFATFATVATGLAESEFRRQGSFAWSRSIKACFRRGGRPRVFYISRLPRLMSSFRAVDGHLHCFLDVGG